MTGKCFSLLLLQLVFVIAESWAQRSSYSLQAAVDEMHRREAAKYPLNAPPSQQHYYGSALSGANDQDYWDDDSVYLANNKYKNRNRHRLNKALAKYLERENYDANHGGLSLGPFGDYEFDEDDNLLHKPRYEKKRSSYFSEHDSLLDDNGPSSVFRERSEPHTTSGGDHAELTEQFLREIEEAQEHEREERYKEALRNLWEKYQQQENEIDGDLFEEKKRLRTPPYYMLMQKKRSSYPVLPWLPYSDRRKRFPVSKRSAKRSPIDSTKTDERVERELSELFGSNDEKKKRSTDDQTKVSTTNSPKIAATTTTIADMRLEVKKENETATELATKSALAVEKPHEHGHVGHHGGHAEKEHKHRKRSDHHSHESREEDSESEEDHEEDGADEEYEHEDFEDEDDEMMKRKKKRDIGDGRSAGNLEIFKAVQTPSRKFDFRKKKAIDWSKYFGLDRKKKAMNIGNDLSADMKKRNANDDNDKKKREIDPAKLDNMDKKLQSIEDFIIDETIKYTGAHEGVANPEEIRRLKDHVLSRLATAYSLEKMRRALEKLRQSVDTENHLLRNVIEAENSENANNQKHSSVKKEQHFHDIQHLLRNDKSKNVNSNALQNVDKNSSESNEDSNEEDEIVKKKKKRNSYLRYPELPNDFADIEEELGGVGRYETLNDAYLGNKNYIIGSKQCPLIESMAERCRGVDILSGDLNQELLPICGVHQICYLCGTSQVACDYQYLAEADAICGNNNDCEAAARSVLMILRGTPGPQLGPRECLKNPCLYSAMREIGL